ncbi:MAG TPA: hypothetical protein VGG28_35145 [Kofleriaceae bacterium]|jgi:hypothetical protein
MTDRSKRPTLRETPNPDEATNVWDGQPPKPPVVAQPPAQQMRAISKKTPGQPYAKPNFRDTPERALPVVKLRAMSEISSGSITPPSAKALGYLAPPRDPAEARARRQRDFVVWGSVCVMIACGIALVIWFVAR